MCVCACTCKGDPHSLPPPAVVSQGGGAITCVFKRGVCVCVCPCVCACLCACLLAHEGGDDVIPLPPRLEFNPRPFSCWLQGLVTGPCGFGAGGGIKETWAPFPPRSPNFPPSQGPGGWGLGWEGVPRRGGGLAQSGDAGKETWKEPGREQAAHCVRASACAHACVGGVRGWLLLPPSPSLPCACVCVCPPRLAHRSGRWGG